jgi:hypothetical protein
MIHYTIYEFYHPVLISTKDAIAAVNQIIEIKITLNFP